MIEADAETGEVALVGLGHLGDDLLLGTALAAGADGDRGAVRVIGADVDAAGVAAHLLEAHPDIGLEVLDEVAEVHVPVGVWQG